MANLGDLFWAGTTVIVALLLVAMAMQITIAKTADGLGAETVRALGADFGLVLLAMLGFVMAFTGLAHAVSVMAHGVLPRWTAWLAIVAVVVNVVGTVGVFFDSGLFSMEGGFSLRFRSRSGTSGHRSPSCARETGCGPSSSGRLLLGVLIVTPARVERSRRRGGARASTTATTAPSWSTRC